MKRSLAILIICVLIVFSVSGCGNGTSKNDNKNGNKFTATKPVNTVDEVYWGNRNNSGMVGETDRYIYVGDRPYRIDKKSGEAEYLCTDPVCLHSNGCVSSGGFNFIMSSEERVFGELVTISTNGIDEKGYVELQSDGKYQSISSDSIIAIIDDKAYVDSYERIDDNNGKSSFKVIDINTNEVVKTADLGKMRTDEVPEPAFIQGEYIYCTNAYNDFVRVDINSGKLTKIAGNVISPLPVGGDIFFLYPHKDDEGLDICKMGIDGKNVTKVIKNSYYSYNIYDNKIYYITASYPKTLCSADLSGENIKELHNGSDEMNSVLILPKAKLIVFSDTHKGIDDGSTDNTCSYSCGLDGSNLQKLAKPEKKVGAD